MKAVNLARALIERLNQVSQIELGFPHEFFTMDMVRALSSGGMRDQNLGRDATMAPLRTNAQLMWHSRFHNAGCMPNLASAKEPI